MRWMLPGRDVPWMDFVSRLRRELSKDSLGAVAGSVTFAALLSLFPFLIFLVALAGILTDPAQISALVDQLKTVVPAEGLDFIESYLSGLLEASGGGILTVGALGAMWAAGRGVRAFMHALNVAYSFEERRPAWKIYLLSTATVLVSSVGLVLLLALVVALPALAGVVRVPILPVLVWLRLPIAGLLLMLVWAAFDSLLPAQRRPYRPFTFGNLVGVGGWLLASWGFSLYVRNFGHFNATYGALGGVIILLLWMNLSVQCFLLAAEVNGVMEAVEREASGLSSPGDVPPAVRPSPEEARAVMPESSSTTGPESRLSPERGGAVGRSRADGGSGREVQPHSHPVARLVGVGAALVLLARQWRATRARP